MGEKKKVGRNGRCEYDYKIVIEMICRRVERKDLGVTFSENMLPDKHINILTGQTLNLLRNIRMTLVYQDEERMRKIISYNN